MKMKAVARFAVLSALFVWAAPSELAAQDDRFEWNGTVARGDVIEVKGITGDIRAVRASGSRVEVVATKHGRSRNFDEVEIQVVEGDDGVTICAMYPLKQSRRRGSDDSYECEPGGWRGVNIDDVDVDVDFEVRVPAGVEFTGRTISGDVEAEGLDAYVVARTISGNIVVTTEDLADASTVSGSIYVTLGRADWRGDLEFHTVSGDITIAFPGSLETDIEFETVNGDVESDFPITLTSRSNRWIGGHLRGTIGDGGRSLSLKTVSGDVELRQGR
jgi:DUF4097 and DUF4098 domain-containing protein YvlB